MLCFLIFQFNTKDRKIIWDQCRSERNLSKSVNVDFTDATLIICCHEPTYSFLPAVFSAKAICPLSDTFSSHAYPPQHLAFALTARQVRVGQGRWVFPVRLYNCLVCMRVCVHVHACLNGFVRVSGHIHHFYTYMQAPKIFYDELSIQYYISTSTRISRWKILTNKYQVLIVCSIIAKDKVYFCKYLRILSIFRLQTAKLIVVNSIFFPFFLSFARSAFPVSFSHH